MDFILTTACEKYYSDKSELNYNIAKEAGCGFVVQRLDDNIGTRVHFFGYFNAKGDIDKYKLSMPKDFTFVRVKGDKNILFILKDSDGYLLYVARGDGKIQKLDIKNPDAAGEYILTVECFKHAGPYEIQIPLSIYPPLSSNLYPKIEPLSAEGGHLKYLSDITTLALECPVNATITDRDGRTISDDGTNEIPGADMFITEDTKIFYLPADLTYSTEIDAYDSCTFNFTSVSPVGNEISITKFEDIPITSNTKVSVDIVPEETDYTMSIDSEGDGEYESNILPDVSETIEVGPILTTIEVAPSTKTLYSGNTQQFTATAKDQYGDPMTGIAIEWTSSNTAVGTVSPMSATTGSDGTATTTFRAASAGTTTVKAAYGDVSGMATVTVQTKTEEPSTVKRGGGGGGGGGPSDTDGDGISDLSEKVDGTNRYDPCDPDPDCFACLAKLGLTPKPKPKERSAAMMPFGVAMPAATETTTETPAETVTPEPTEATPAPKQPGFDAVFAIVGLLAVAYVAVRRKRK
jgi:PGF-CTERM protein